jgi:hypothetical protein
MIKIVSEKHYKELENEVIMGERELQCAEKRHKDNLKLIKDKLISIVDTSKQTKKKEIIQEIEDVIKFIK